MFRSRVSTALLGWFVLLTSSPVVAAELSDAQMLARGRYVLTIGGCNDCHTAGFAPSGGAVPESDWLKGDALGYQGPWGTTYPPNLRAYFAALSEDQWVALAPAFRARPPMPFWAVNAMNEGDLRAVYRFVRSLGPVGDPAPAYAAPGVAVTTPLVVFQGPPDH